MRERRVKMQKRDEIQGSSWGGGGEWVRTYRPLSLPWAGLVPLPPRSPFALPVSASGSSSAWLQLVGVMRVCVRARMGWTPCLGTLKTPSSDIARAGATGPLRGARYGADWG
jgi:hypothetical protein